MISTLVRSLIIRNDLEGAGKEFSRKGILALAHVKTACLAFHNLVELEREIRGIYKDHRDLSSGFESVRAEAQFFSYLRNKFAGHLTEELIQKALEWKPEIPLTLQRDDHCPNLILIYNYAILETAINTYVDDKGKHRLFDGETDLAYPPDFERFKVTFLGACEKASVFLKHVEEILKPAVPIPETETMQLELWLKAGQTDFAFIRGRGR